MQSKEQIKFYRPNHAHGYLSNFYHSPFVIGQTVYTTNQHYFQSKKYEGHAEQKLVIEAKTPAQAFKLGRNKTFPRRKDWQAIKDDIMYDGLRRKFKTHIDLRDKLLSTGNAKIIEHTHKDSYWADGGDGKGKNRLGILLMKLRTQIKKQQAKKSEDKQKVDQKQ